MIELGTIKENLSQISALTEKNIKLRLRYKAGLIISFIFPIVTILTPLIVMGNLFQTRSNIGNWTEENFMIYQFIAYNIFLLRELTFLFPEEFLKEKYWKTLPALIIGPFNRFNLLISILSSHLVLVSIPFSTFLVIGYLFYPIGISTLIIIIFLYLAITLVFSGIGLMLGAFTISNENIWKILRFVMYFIFWFSCITYPYEIFPKIIQNVINLNPLYYLFDILRLSWIQNNIFLTLNLYPLHFILLLCLAIIFPLIGVYFFNIIYKKYGITGY